MSGLNDRTTGSRKKTVDVKQKSALWKKKEIQWETKEAASEAAGGGMECVCRERGRHHKTPRKLTRWRWCLHSAYDFYY